MPMISPDMQTTSLLAKTARLLDSVAEAAWTNNIPAPLKWDLHRIGTDAYLAQRDILDALGQGAMPVDPLPVVDIAAALEEAAQSLAAISQAGHNVATKRLEQRVASLARRALALTPQPDPHGTVILVSGFEGPVADRRMWRVLDSNDRRCPQDHPPWGSPSRLAPPTLSTGPGQPAHGCAITRRLAERSALQGRVLSNENNAEVYPG